MDFAAAVKFVRAKIARDSFEDKEDSEKKTIDLGTPFLVVLVIVFIVLAIIAIKLSWSSNSRIGWSTPMKVFFALMTIVFSPVSYIIAHIIYKMDLLSYINKNQCGLQMSAMSPPQSSFAQRGGRAAMTRRR